MCKLVSRAAAAVILSGVFPLSLWGQFPGLPPASLPIYQAPVIALAQPASGGSVPQDKPVVVFRFTSVESADPIDARSFAVTVDGKDNTSVFQMTGTEAWGPLMSASQAIDLGRHEVVARICSSRGACNTASAVVNVASAGPASGEAAAKGQSKKVKILDALLGAIRTLIKS
jgi:hypothetical protein